MQTQDLIPHSFRNGHLTMLIVKMLYDFPIIIGKKNNNSSVPGGREIPTLGSTDNAGNSVNLVYPRVGIYLSASEADDRFYLSFPLTKTAHTRD